LGKVAKGVGVHGGKGVVETEKKKRRDKNRMLVNKPKDHKAVFGGKSNT